MAILNRDLYSLLRSNSLEEAKNVARALGLNRDETDFLLSMHALAEAASENDFKNVLERAPDVFPFRQHLDAQEQETARQRFDAALHGRKVVLVGPSQTVIGSGRREEIEAFDVVVRMNFQWPVPSHLEPDIGSRMDVLYHCCNGDYPVEPLLTDAFLHTRFVCFEDNIEARILCDFCRKHDVPALDVSGVYRDLSGALRTEVNTGLAAIDHLLSTGLEELYICGVTFFQRPYYDAYRGDGAKASLWESGSPPTRIHRHEFGPQLNYFMELARKDSRIRPDEALREVMSRAQARV